MRYFNVEAKYLIPFDEIAPVIPRHRSFLQAGYDQGFFLCSGPQASAAGGFLVARAESQERLEAMFADEPFNAGKRATYTFTQFDPVKRQPWADDWFNGNP